MLQALLKGFVWGLGFRLLGALVGGLGFLGVRVLFGGLGFRLLGALVGGLGFLGVRVLFGGLGFRV